MLNQRLAFGLLAGMLFFLACTERSIDFDIPFEEPKLVLRALLQHNEIGTVYLHRTFDPARPGPDILVPDAEVVLVSGEERIAQFHYRDSGDEINNGSRYQSDAELTFRRDVPYRIIVETPRGEKLTTHDVYLPPAAAIDTVDLVIYKPENSGRWLLQNTAVWISQMQRELGYTLMVESLFFDENGTFYERRPLTAYFSPPADPNRTGDQRLNLLFNDRLYANIDADTSIFARDTLYFSLQSISPEYAQWIDLAEDIEPELGGFSSFIQEIPDNAEGGYGIFGISNITQLKIDF